MNRLEMPANIKLMNTNDPRIKSFRMVTSLDTFDGMNTNNFHPDGLFSTEIFGRVGTPERDTQFSFIHTKIPIFNPYIYKKITGLKALYKGIITGKQYATWNDKDKDFEPSDLVNGETGFAFFLSRLTEIKFKQTSSASREADIKLVYGAIQDGTALITHVPVFPAGLRDAYIEADGRVTEDEVNPLYRSLISAANALPDSIAGTVSTTPSIEVLDEAVYNTTRMTLQNSLIKIFDYFWLLFSGKRGFARDKYYSRGVFNGTRNVLSALCTTVEELGSPHTPGLNDTTIGVFQVMKMIQPVTINLLLNGWLGNAFSARDGSAYLVDRKTRKMVTVSLKRDVYDKFTTPEGLIKCINSFFIRPNRTKPVIIDGHYLALVYKGEINGKKVFKLFNDIDDLPKELDVNDVHPLTWCELFYISGYREWNNYPTMFTRYPVAGLGSTYMSMIYCKTTVIAEQRWELNDEWEIKEFHDANRIHYAYEYPIIKKNVNFFETVAISPSRLAGATADFDGDTGSQIAVYTEESLAEVKDHLNSATAYIDPKGGLLNSPFIDTVHRTVVGLMRR